MSVSGAGYQDRQGAVHASSKKSAARKLESYQILKGVGASSETSGTAYLTLVYVSFGLSPGYTLNT